MQDIRISVCICTRNRPDDLAKAIRSVLASSQQPHEIVVSDDSSNPLSRDLVSAQFPEVVFVEGPRKGLGPNRNCALGAVTGTHIAFIDDDVLMDSEFIRIVTEHAREADENTIISGIEINNGVRVDPHGVSFLGHQSIDYAEGQEHKTIVINSTAFPRMLFTRTLFDPNLIYGCDEMDIALRATTLHGCRIIFDPRLRNQHFPSPVNRDVYLTFKEASRIYVMIKYYYFVQRSISKSILFAAIAANHNLLYCVRKEGLRGFRKSIDTFRSVYSYIRKLMKERATYV